MLVEDTRSWSARQGARVWRRLRRITRRLDELDAANRLGSIAEVGPGCGAWGRIALTGAANMRLGSNVHIGDGAFIRAEGGLSIGSNTHISRNVTIYTRNHQSEGEALPYDDTFDDRPVTIGRNVWIGMDVCITPGVTIGDGAIVGMGTVVAGTVAAGAIVVSQAARVVGSRDPDRYERLENAGAFGGPSGVPLRSLRAPDSSA